MTLEEILIDTLEYYGADENRYCKGLRTCEYSPFTLGIEEISEGCAVGRLLTPELAILLDENGVSSIEEIQPKLDPDEEEDDKSHLLPVQVQQKLIDNMDFFMELQDFHDCKRIINGVLTDTGKSNLIRFINDYNFDQSKFTKWLS